MLDPLLWAKTSQIQCSSIFSTRTQYDASVQLYCKALILMVLSAPRTSGRPGETQKCRPDQERCGNTVKNTKNLEKTGIILGSVKHRSAPNDKTRNTGFYMADVLSKLIGWLPAIPSMKLRLTNPHSINIKDGGNLVLLSWWFLETITIIIIF